MSNQYSNSRLSSATAVVPLLVLLKFYPSLKASSSLFIMPELALMLLVGGYGKKYCPAGAFILEDYPKSPSLP
jgi:hypothetical protein